MSLRYLPSRTLDEYLSAVASLHPQLHPVLDFQRPGCSEALDRLVAASSEFDSDHNGRGDSYRRAQRDPLVRWTGIRTLLEFAVPDTSGEAPLVLDVLGGDGTLARAVGSHTGSVQSKLTIITGDISGPMVDRALAQGLPAVRQAAQFLFIREMSVHAVLLAYGTHHISPDQRPAAVAEAVRVTRPGGRVVLHDFDEASPMAGFFADVVHPHAAGGHQYSHFTRDGLHELFRDVGLPARVRDVNDPLVVRADTEQSAKERMCRYIGDMYGVADYFAGLGGVDEAWRLLIRYFDHSRYRGIEGPNGPVTYRQDGQFVALVPRMAIVAVAAKPA